MLALVSSATVGVASGSSWAIRYSTAGVYGAFDATDGDVAVAGNCTGSAYGTSDGVLGCTQPAGVAAVPATVAGAAVLAPAGAVPTAMNETTAAAATATVVRLPGSRGTFPLFL